MINQTRPLHVCYFGTYRQDYSRNQIMIEGLRRAGVEVVECHEPLWRGIEDRVQAASGGWLSPRFIWRMARTYWRLLVKFRRVTDFDIIVVGYPGQLDVFLARLLTWLRHKPLVWDIFMSIYLIAIERRLNEHSRFTINLLRSLEWGACRLPDRLIIDTSDYMEWFGKTYHIPTRKFRLIPTGADDRFFHPGSSSRVASSFFHVIYYGTFIPNHGIKYIVEAARLLEGDPGIQFELIGDGPERNDAQELSNRYNLRNVTFISWMEKTELVQRVAEADVCLGAFGSTPQSLMTVQNKIYEGLAMAKPVITGDSPAVRKALIHGEQIYLCERENPFSLTEAIRYLKNNPDLCQRLEQNGYSVFCDRYSVRSLGQKFASVLREMF